jgi:glycosyltransferase involved in cell wall biosynthesis
MREILATEGVSGVIWRIAIRVRMRHLRYRPPKIVTTGRDALSQSAELRGTQTFGVNFVGYLTGEFGNGTSARAFAEALTLTRVPHVLNNLVDDLHKENKEYVGELSGHAPFPISIFHVNAATTEAFFRENSRMYSQSKFNIGIWYWELSRFPKRWMSAFRFYNEIWVTSSFVCNSLSEISPIPIRRVRYPLSIDTTRIDTGYRERLGFDHEFVFLYAFDSLSFFERKNPVAVIKAFGKAFPGDKDVMLLLHPIGKTSSNQMRQLERASAQNVVVRERLSRSEYLSLVAASDCYVSLHRSEGLGLTLAEAMYLGKPVIATAYGGNLDFMNVENSLLVPYQLVELQRDNGPYAKGNFWAEPDIDSAAQYMRWVRNNPEKAAKLGERAKADIRKTLDPVAASMEIRDRLRVIFAQIQSIEG